MQKLYYFPIAFKAMHEADGWETVAYEDYGASGFPRTVVMRSPAERKDDETNTGRNS